MSGPFRILIESPGGDLRHMTDGDSTRPVEFETDQAALDVAERLNDASWRMQRETGRRVRYHVDGPVCEW